MMEGIDFNFKNGDMYMKRLCYVTMVCIVIFLTGCSQEDINTFVSIANEMSSGAEMLESLGDKLSDVANERQDDELSVVETSGEGKTYVNEEVTERSTNSAEISGEDVTYVTEKSVGLAVFEGHKEELMSMLAETEPIKFSDTPDYILPTIEETVSQITYGLIRDPFIRDESGEPYIDTVKRDAEMLLEANSEVVVSTENSNRVTYWRNYCGHFPGYIYVYADNSNGFYTYAPLSYVEHQLNVICGKLEDGSLYMYCVSHMAAEDVWEEAVKDCEKYGYESYCTNWGWYKEGFVKEYRLRKISRGK